MVSITFGWIQRAERMLLSSEQMNRRCAVQIGDVFGGALIFLFFCPVIQSVTSQTKLHKVRFQGWRGGGPPWMELLCVRAQRCVAQLCFYSRS